MQLANLLIVFFLLCNPTDCAGIDMHSIWKEWKDVHGKQYATQWEEDMREEIFNKNYLYIQRHNELYDQGLASFSMSLNKFADLTQLEFDYAYLTLAQAPYASLARGEYLADTSASGDPLPESLDWRDSGFVTPVKNQGKCGSCWAFSAVGSLEGMVKKKTGTLYDLSEQQLVDCIAKYNCLRGGLMEGAYEYWKSDGSQLEEDYPYTGKQETCKFNETKVVTQVRSFKRIKSMDEDQLMQAVALVGPIAVALDSSSPDFKFYTGGIYTDEYCSSYYLNHAVVLIGYSQDENGTPYWIVKNSWGLEWGMQGYGWIARNHSNMCGIATMASYPVV